MKPDELLYVAFKDMIMANLKSGFLRQHISDSTYYAFDKYPELFIEVIEVSKERYSTDKMVQNFFTLNPERLKDISFAKKVFKNIVSSEDFRFMINSFGEELFINDFELMKEVVKNIGAEAFNDYYGFKKSRNSEKLREALYELDNFNLAWFDLPAPNDNNIILEALIKNPIGYSKLTEQQKENKEFALVALTYSKKGGDSSTENIYKLIPEKFKCDEDIALLVAKGGVINQPLLVFDYDNVLLEALNSSIPKNKYKIKLVIPEVKLEIFKNSKNIETFFKFLNDNKEFIEYNHELYSSWYKVLKGMVKYNSYIKEQFEKGGNWNLGNPGEVKNKGKPFFNMYFNEVIPELYGEVKYFVMADQLSKQLPKKDIKEVKVKI